MERNLALKFIFLALALLLSVTPALARHGHFRHHHHFRHWHSRRLAGPPRLASNWSAGLPSDSPATFFEQDYARMRQLPPAIVYQTRRAPVEHLVHRLAGNVWDMVRQSAASHGVPQAVAIAIVRQESGGRCHPGGVGGIMQVLPRTARAMGVSGNSCAASLEAGMRYLAQIVHAHGTSCAALSLYNVGAAARPHCTAYGRNILRLARL